ncbi:OmpA family protein [Billgrantia sp. C5P2]|uniref:OmpA family protein n=1 Tax=Billgrantia sp. C5P2 TaxID=3436239 RepID=UPI003DA21BEE
MNNRLALASTCGCVALIAGTAFAVEDNERVPDLSSTVILPIERIVIPIERTAIPIEGLALGTVASISPLAKQAMTLSETSEAIEVTVVGDEIRLSILGDVLFAFDSDAIEPDGARVLEELAAFLRASDIEAVLVEGHTDSIGSASYNLELSERRAQAAINWLIENEQLSDIEFTPEGHGFERPVADNAHPDGSDNPEGRQQNRRVEFVIDESD